MHSVLYFCGALIGILLMTHPLYSQISYRTSNNNGTVRGYILDRSTGKGVMDAYVELLNYHPTISTTTDGEGYFELKNVPVGHQRLHVIREGYYEALYTQLVTAGKEAVVSISLEEQFVMPTVTVEGSSSGGRINNSRNTKQATIDPMNAVSARPVNVEEVRKFVSGFNDPVRALTNYPGLYNMDDSENYLVSRSNSPQGVQNLIEGIPFENPNHFPVLGHTGGIFPLVNSNALDNSDFANGTFGAQYGNVYAGVLDMNLREGNNLRHEFMGQIGIFGADVMAEGPISKRKGSYLVVGRVGIFSLLQAAQIDIGTKAVPQYGDLNFKINLDTKKGGSWSVFGVGGYGRADLLNENVDSSDLFTQWGSNNYFRTYSALVGVRNVHYFDETTSLKTTLSGVLQHYLQHQDTVLNGAPEYNYSGHLKYDHYGVQTVLNKKFSNKLLFRAGLQSFVYVYDSYRFYVPSNQYFIWVKENQFMGSAYAQVQYRFSRKLTTTLGVHAFYWNINANNWSVEPRLAINWEMHPRHRLSFGYGWHSKVQSAELIYSVSLKEDGTYDQSNRNLGPTRSHQLVLTYDWSITRNLVAKFNAYGFYNYDLAVEKIPSSYAAMNYEATAGWLRTYTGLVNGGEQLNYGIEASLEHFFSKGFYGLASASYQRSFYKASDGIVRSSAYDLRYIGSVAAGKEFKIGPNKRNSIYTDLRFNIREGAPTTPIDLDASLAVQSTVWQEDKAFTERLNTYKRLDVRVGMRFNHGKRRISHHVYLEVLNIAGFKNDLTVLYRPELDRVVRAKQFGLFPNFLYQVRF